MDPNATWRMIVEAYGEDEEQVRELAEALSYWLDDCGFPPKITGKEKFDRFVSWHTCQMLLLR